MNQSEFPVFAPPAPLSPMPGADVPPLAPLSQPLLGGLLARDLAGGSPAPFRIHPIPIAP